MSTACGSEKSITQRFPESPGRPAMSGQSLVKDTPQPLRPASAARSWPRNGLAAWSMPPINRTPGSSQAIATTRRPIRPAAPWTIRSSFSDVIKKCISQSRLSYRGSSAKPPVVELEVIAFPTGNDNPAPNNPAGPHLAPQGDRNQACGPRRESFMPNELPVSKRRAQDGRAGLSPESN